MDSTLRPIARLPGRALTLLLAASTAAAVSAQTPSATSAPEQTVVLSPFQVDASAEQGYIATQTLSGTRFKTELRDPGAAITICTEQMMDDLGATNINDVLAFSPNTDPFVTTLADTSSRGLEFLNNGTQYVTRGGRTEVVGQDFSRTIFRRTDIIAKRSPFRADRTPFYLGLATRPALSSRRRSEQKTEPPPVSNRKPMTGAASAPCSITIRLSRRACFP